MTSEMLAGLEGQLDPLPDCGYAMTILLNRSLKGEPELRGRFCLRSGHYARHHHDRTLQNRPPHPFERSLCVHAVVPPWHHSG